MPGTLTADVAEVKDGDTLVVVGSGKRITVRVWGIDAPETSQPYGTAATRAARKLVGGETVTLHVEDTGPYGRLIARVRTEDTDLGQSLTYSGYAWYSRKYATSETLKNCEREARTKRAGLWQQDDPVPPWTHREQTGEPDLLDAARTGWKIGRWFWKLLP